MPAATDTILALDVGDVRIGVAMASYGARLASPHSFIQNSPDVMDNIAELIQKEHAQVLVVGLPRGMQGQDTQQTEVVKQFVAELKQKVDIPVHTQDEALTSRYAEEELELRGKPFEKGDIDALAATYILKDFLADHSGTL